MVLIDSNTICALLAVTNENGVPPQIASLGETAHLVTSFKHFMYFVQVCRYLGKAAFDTPAFPADVLDTKFSRVSKCTKLLIWLFDNTMRVKWCTKRHTHERIQKTIPKAIMRPLWNGRGTTGIWI